MVAALVENVEGGEDRWILAEVVAYNPVTKKYEVTFNQLLFLNSFFTR